MAANFAKLPDLLQRLKAMTQTTPKPPLATYVAALGYPTGNAFSPFDSITYRPPARQRRKKKPMNGRTRTMVRLMQELGFR